MIPGMLSDAAVALHTTCRGASLWAYSPRQRGRCTKTGTEGMQCCVISVAQPGLRPRWVNLSKKYMHAAAAASDRGGSHSCRWRHDHTVMLNDMQADLYVMTLSGLVACCTFGT